MVISVSLKEGCVLRWLAAAFASCCGGGSCSGGSGGRSEFLATPWFILLAVIIHHLPEILQETVLCHPGGALTLEPSSKAIMSLFIDTFRPVSKCDWVIEPR